jgi:hypothetical protein
MASFQFSMDRIHYGQHKPPEKRGGKHPIFLENRKKLQEVTRYDATLSLPPFFVPIKLAFGQHPIRTPYGRPKTISASVEFAPQGNPPTPGEGDP